MARTTFLPFALPDITEAEIAEVTAALRSNWITTGPRTRQLEQVFADYLGRPEALGLNSCTAGLHVALATAGIGPGDEVITTTYTFCATVNVIEHVGARPVLVDICADTLNIDPTQIESAITSRTRAIIPVHYGGHCCDMETIMAIARRYKLIIIEDCAHALPASFQSQPAGTFGDFAAFSFYATKTMTTAEGGMLVARDTDMIDQARIFSLHGMSRDAWKRFSSAGSWYYEVITPGFKYNMTDLSAALGLAQFQRLEEMQRNRAAIAASYNQAFCEVSALQIPALRPGVRHSWHLYPLRLHLNQLRIGRTQFIEEMKAHNIGTSVHYIPIHLHPFYRDRYGYQPDSFPIAHREYQRLISLPLYSTMSAQDVNDVIEAVVSIVERFQR